MLAGGLSVKGAAHFDVVSHRLVRYLITAQLNTRENVFAESATPIFFPRRKLYFFLEVDF